MRVSYVYLPLMHLAQLRGRGGCSIGEIDGPFSSTTRDREAQYEEEGFRHSRIRPHTPP